MKRIHTFSIKPEDKEAQEVVMYFNSIGLNFSALIIRLLKDEYNRHKKDSDNRS